MKAGVIMEYANACQPVCPDYPHSANTEGEIITIVQDGKHQMDCCFIIDNKLCLAINIVVHITVMP